MAERGMSVNCTVAPGNSATVVPLDSTWGLAFGSQASQHASTGAYLVPGPFRNKWSKAIVNYTILTTGQNVTVLDQELTGVAGVAGDWETIAGGSHTATASTTLPVTFTTRSADWRIRIDAGGTGPTTCVVKISVTWAA